MIQRAGCRAGAKGTGEPAGAEEGQFGPVPRAHLRSHAVPAAPAGVLGWGVSCFPSRTLPDLDIGNRSLPGPRYCARKEREESHAFPFLSGPPSGLPPRTGEKDAGGPHLQPQESALWSPKPSCSICLLLGTCWSPCLGVSLFCSRSQHAASSAQHFRAQPAAALEVTCGREWATVIASEEPPG